MVLKGGKMNNQDSIKALTDINNQIPNPYFKGVWYDVTMPNGKPAQAMRTKPGFLRMRRMINHVLKSPNGEIINQKMEYSYFRCNLITGEVVEL